MSPRPGTATATTRATHAVGTKDGGDAGDREDEANGHDGSADHRHGCGGDDGVDDAARDSDGGVASAARGGEMLDPPLLHRGPPLLHRMRTVALLGYTHSPPPHPRRCDKGNFQATDSLGFSCRESIVRLGNHPP